jgi:hypothetical protein
MSRTGTLATVEAELVVVAEILDDHDHMIALNESLRIATSRQWRHADSYERSVSCASLEGRL